jgi:hypothetical protein
VWLLALLAAKSSSRLKHSRIMGMFDVVNARLPGELAVTHPFRPSEKAMVKLWPL